jgi:hypothetical protein
VILIREQTLRVTVVRLVLDTLPVLDVMSIALLSLYDVMNSAQGGILAIVV